MNIPWHFASSDGHNVDIFVIPVFLSVRAPLAVDVSRDGSLLLRLDIKFC